MALLIKAFLDCPDDLFKAILGKWKGIPIIAIGPKGGQIIGYGSNGKPIYAGSKKAESLAATKDHFKGKSKSDMGSGELVSIVAWLQSLGIPGKATTNYVRVNPEAAEMMSEAFGVEGKPSIGNTVIILMEQLLPYVGEPLKPPKGQKAAWAAHIASGQHENSVFPDDLSTLKHVDTVGSHGVWHMKDKNGKSFFFKKGSQVIARAEEAALRLGRLVLGDRIAEGQMVEIDGKKGVLLSGLDGEVFNQSSHSDPPSKYLKKYRLQVIEHEILDWFISNHDPHAGNFLADGEKMNGIDKGQAWKWIGKDKLDPAYKGTGSQNPSNAIYYKFWNEVKAGNISTDGFVDAAAKVIGEIEKISDVQFTEILRPYLTEAKKEHGKDPKKLLQKMLDRKNSMRSDFETFFSEQFDVQVVIPKVGVGEDNFETMPEAKEKTTVKVESAVKKIEGGATKPVPDEAQPEPTGWPITKGKGKGTATVHNPGEPPPAGGEWPKGIPGPGCFMSVKYKGQVYQVYVGESMIQPGKPTFTITYPDGEQSKFKSANAAGDSLYLFHNKLPILMSGTDKKEKGITLGSYGLKFKLFEKEFASAYSGGEISPNQMDPKSLEKEGLVEPDQDEVSIVQLLENEPDGIISDPGMLPTEVQDFMKAHGETVGENWPAAIIPGTAMKLTSQATGAVIIVTAFVKANGDPGYRLWQKYKNNDEDVTFKDMGVLTPSIIDDAYDLGADTGLKFVKKETASAANWESMPKDESAIKEMLGNHPTGTLYQLKDPNLEAPLHTFKKVVTSDGEQFQVVFDIWNVDDPTVAHSVSGLADFGSMEIFDLKYKLPDFMEDFAKVPSADSEPVEPKTKPLVGSAPEAELPKDAVIPESAPKHYKGPMPPGAKVTVKKKFEIGTATEKLDVELLAKEDGQFEIYIPHFGTLKTFKSLSAASDYVWVKQKGYVDADDYKAKNNTNKIPSGGGWKFFGINPKKVVEIEAEPAVSIPDLETLQNDPNSTSYVVALPGVNSPITWIKANNNLWKRMGPKIFGAPDTLSDAGLDKWFLDQSGSLTNADQVKKTEVLQSWQNHFPTLAEIKSDVIGTEYFFPADGFNIQWIKVADSGPYTWKRYENGKYSDWADLSNEGFKDYLLGIMNDEVYVAPTKSTGKTPPDAEDDSPSGGWEKVVPEVGVSDIDGWPEGTQVKLGDWIATKKPDGKWSYIMEGEPEVTAPSSTLLNDMQATEDAEYVKFPELEGGWEELLQPGFSDFKNYPLGTQLKGVGAGKADKKFGKDDIIWTKVAPKIWKNDYMPEQNVDYTELPNIWNLSKEVHIKKPEGGESEDNWDSMPKVPNLQTVMLWPVGTELKGVAEDFTTHTYTKIDGKNWKHTAPTDAGELSPNESMLVAWEVLNNVKVKQAPNWGWDAVPQPNVSDVQGLPVGTQIKTAYSDGIHFWKKISENNWEHIKAGEDPTGAMEDSVITDIWTLVGDDVPVMVKMPESGEPDTVAAKPSAGNEIFTGGPPTEDVLAAMPAGTVLTQVFDKTKGTSADAFELGDVYTYTKTIHDADADNDYWEVSKDGKTWDVAKDGATNKKVSGYLESDYAAQEQNTFYFKIYSGDAPGKKENKFLKVPGIPSIEVLKGMKTGMQFVVVYDDGQSSVFTKAGPNAWEVSSSLSGEVVTLSSAIAKDDLQTAFHQGADVTVSEEPVEWGVPEDKDPVLSHPVKGEETYFHNVSTVPSVQSLIDAPSGTVYMAKFEGADWYYTKQDAGGLGAHSTWKVEKVPPQGDDGPQVYGSVPMHNELVDIFTDGTPIFVSAAKQPEEEKPKKKQKPNKKKIPENAHFDTANLPAGTTTIQKSKLMGGFDVMAEQKWLEVKEGGHSLAEKNPGWTAWAPPPGVFFSGVADGKLFYFVTANPGWKIDGSSEPADKYSCAIIDDKGDVHPGHVFGKNMSAAKAIKEAATVIPELAGMNANQLKKVFGLGKKYAATETFESLKEGLGVSSLPTVDEVIDGPVETASDAAKATPVQVTMPLQKALEEHAVAKKYGDQFKIKPAKKPGHSIIAINSKAEEAASDFGQILLDYGLAHYMPKKNQWGVFLTLPTHVLQADTVVEMPAVEASEVPATPSDDNWETMPDSIPKSLNMDTYPYFTLKENFNQMPAGSIILNPNNLKMVEKKVSGQFFLSDGATETSTLQHSVVLDFMSGGVGKNWVFHPPGWTAQGHAGQPLGDDIPATFDMSQYGYSKMKNHILPMMPIGASFWNEEDQVQVKKMSQHTWVVVEGDNKLGKWKNIEDPVEVTDELEGTSSKVWTAHPNGWEPPTKKVKTAKLKKPAKKVFKTYKSQKPSIQVLSDAPKGSVVVEPGWKYTKMADGPQGVWKAQNAETKAIGVEKESGELQEYLDSPNSSKPTTLTMPAPKPLTAAQKEKLAEEEAAKKKKLEELKVKLAKQKAEQEVLIAKAKEVAAWAKDYPTITAKQQLLGLAHLQAKLGKEWEGKIWARQDGKGNVLLGSEEPGLDTKLKEVFGKITSVDSPLGSFWKISNDKLKKAFPGSTTTKGPDGKMYPVGTAFDTKTVTEPKSKKIESEPGFVKFKDHKSDDTLSALKVAPADENGVGYLKGIVDKYELTPTGDPLTGNSYVMQFFKKTDLAGDVSEVVPDYKIPEQPKSFMGKGLPTYDPSMDGEIAPNNRTDVAMLDGMKLGSYGMGIRFGKAGVLNDYQLGVRKVKDHTGKVFYEFTGNLADRNPTGKQLKSGSMSFYSTEVPDSHTSYSKPNYDKETGIVTESSKVMEVDGAHKTYSAWVGTTEAGTNIELAKSNASTFLQGRFRIRIPEGADRETELAEAFTRMGVDAAKAMGIPDEDDERIFIKSQIVRMGLGPGARNYGNQDQTKLHDEAWLDSQLESLGLTKYVETATIRKSFQGKHSVYIEDQDVAKKKGALFAYQGVSQHMALMQLLYGWGSASRRERYKVGYGGNGASADSDESNGGGQAAYLRLGNKGASGSWGMKCDPGSRALLVYNPRVLQRTDCYIHSGDAFGTTLTAPHESEGKHAKLGSKGGSNEICFESGVSNDDLMGVQVPSSSWKSWIIDKLKANGVEEVNGVKLEDFIVIYSGKSRQGLYDTVKAVQPGEDEDA